jgi:alpha-L-rhamnosidase
MKITFRSLMTISGILSLMLIITWGCSADQKLKVTNLRCEYLENPLGMDVLMPRFSWVITSNRRDISQSAYRILVADSKEALKGESGNIWDSGKVPSDQSVNVTFQGSSLKSDQAYFWIVSVWNQDGEQSSWSEPVLFHTGLFKSSDWSAKWIAAADTLLESPLLRKEFELDKPVRQAYVYVSAAGFYELQLNGKKVGDHVLDPGITDYRKTLQYVTYDVTKELKKGPNAAGIIVGNGGFRLKPTEERYSWGNGEINMGVPRILFQLNIINKDGSQTNVISDESWKSTSGPIVFNNYYGGEDYDARLEKAGWAIAGYDDSDWQPVKVVQSTDGILRSQLMPPIRVVQTILPVAETNPATGVYLFDLGQNIPGWWRLQVKGQEGLTLRVKAAETLNDSMFSAPLKPGDRLSKRRNYQSQIWTDYTLKGQGTEIYEPRFFYTGFRYIEVTTDNPEKLMSLKVEGRVVHSALERNGKFETSDSLLNRIHKATVWSQIGNTHSYPTDCPQREKGGYNGDGQVIAEASIHDFQMAAFYTKWLNDMHDAQQENGRIPNTSPTLIGGMGGGIAWGSAYILLPWWMYEYYNDSRILNVHYPGMKHYIDYLRNLAKTDNNPQEPYVINEFGTYWLSLGEWCAPGRKLDCPNHPVVSTYYFYLDAFTLSRIASVLGEKEDAARYHALADTVKTEFNRKFFNPETNLYGSDSIYQTYQILALSGNIIPDGHREGVLKTVLDDISITREGHLNTGIIGTKYLWPVLAHAGRTDLAYTVATKKTYPSYGYWIENGFTTLCETWEGRNSHNHQMFGSVDEFFFKYLAGIQSPTDGTTSRGYKHIVLKPYIPSGLSYVDASLQTVAGTIESHWHQQSGLLKLKVVIPANSDASISIPILDSENISLTEGEKTIWENGAFVPGVQGIKDANIDNSFLNLSVGSGTYDFALFGHSSKSE